MKASPTAQSFYPVQNPRKGSHKNRAASARSYRKVHHSNPMDFSQASRQGVSKLNAMLH